MKQLTDPKFSRAVACFRLAYLARQRLYYANERARNLYGVAGNVLSGGHFAHWPEDEKRRSRRQNRMANRLADAGFKARPARVQMATMRTVRLEVERETLRSQHGINR